VYVVVDFGVVAGVGFACGFWGGWGGCYGRGMWVRIIWVMWVMWVMGVRVSCRGVDDGGVWDGRFVGGGLLELECLREALEFADALVQSRVLPDGVFKFFKRFLW
jgi:hypothetical protein